MPKISIVVPVYNVEKYLTKCVDSILTQSFEDFELILVDDGSLDESGKMCDEFALKDSRIKVIHKENGGLSSARNAGIDVCMGEFVGFVDSDDYIKNDMYEVLYSDICHYNADIAVCGFYHKYENKCLKSTHKYGLAKGVFDNKEAFKLSFRSTGITLSSVNKLYRLELFKDKRFPVGRTYEDAFLVPELIINSSKVCYNPLPKYYYVHRGNSITSNKFKISDFSDRIDAYKNHLEFVEKNFPGLKNEALFRYIGSYILVFDKMNLSDDFLGSEIYKTTLRNIRENIFFVLKNPLFTAKRKLSALLISINPWLYRKFLRYYSKKNFEIIN